MDDKYISDKVHTYHRRTKPPPADGQQITAVFGDIEPGRSAIPLELKDGSTTTAPLPAESCEQFNVAEGDLLMQPIDGWGKRRSRMQTRQGGGIRNNAAPTAVAVMNGHNTSKDKWAFMGVSKTAANGRHVKSRGGVLIVVQTTGSSKILNTGKDEFTAGDYFIVDPAPVRTSNGEPHLRPHGGKSMALKPSVWRYKWTAFDDWVKNEVAPPLEKVLKSVLDGAGVVVPPGPKAEMKDPARDGYMAAVLLEYSRFVQTPWLNGKPETMVAILGYALTPSLTAYLAAYFTDEVFTAAMLAPLIAHIVVFKALITADQVYQVVFGNLRILPKVVEMFHEYNTRLVGGQIVTGGKPGEWMEVQVGKRPF